MKYIMFAFFASPLFVFSQTTNIGSVKVESKTAIEKNQTIRFRCSNTLALNPPPLFIVNGYVIDSSALSKINPSQIESIDVIKSKDTVKEYGANAENGVIKITVKSQFLKELTDKGVIKQVL